MKSITPIEIGKERSWVDKNKLETSPWYILISKKLDHEKKVY